MTSATKARLLALAALPLLTINIARAGARAAATSPAVPVVLPHISITAIGRGSSVVLIPGLSSPRAVWDGIAPELARTHRVILVQVNGFAGDAPGANLAPKLLEGVVEDLAGYLKAQKLGPADVIGHSMGGLATLMLAHAHPDAVRRLMIVDALPFVGELFAPGATVAQLEPQAAAMRDQMAAGYGKPNPAGAAMAQRMALKPDSQQKVLAWMTAADARVVARAFYDDMITDVTPTLAGIQAPITLVFPYGGPVSQEQAGALYRRAYATAPHVRFVPVADSGHFAMLDQPAAFAAAVRDFLK